MRGHAGVLRPPNQSRSLDGPLERRGESYRDRARAGSAGLQWDRRRSTADAGDDPRVPTTGGRVVPRGFRAGYAIAQ